MKAIHNATNTLFNARFKACDIIIDGDVLAGESFQVKAMAKGSKWQDANQDQYRTLKTKTLKCVGHDHGNGVKKSFKKDKRYQVDEMRPVGTIAGYIFDDEGARWGLYREDVGFSTLDGSLFESKYS